MAIIFQKHGAFSGCPARQSMVRSEIDLLRIAIVLRRQNHFTDTRRGAVKMRLLQRSRPHGGGNFAVIGPAG